MENIENTKTEEEIAELVADALGAAGFAAASQDTGGGICCVILERAGGGEIVWGTADVNWGASVCDENGTPLPPLRTACPSGSQDVAAIVEAIKEPSIRAGAVPRSDRSASATEG